MASNNNHLTTSHKIVSRNSSRVWLGDSSVVHGVFSFPLPRGRSKIASLTCLEPRMGGKKAVLSGASLHLPLLVVVGPLPAFSPEGLVEVTCLLRALRD